MISTNKIIKVVLKSTLIAAVLFWTISLSAGRFGSYIFLVFLLSMIPIFMLCLLTILLTIMPFYWIEKGKLKNDEIFRKYFPYHSITTFGICSFFLLSEKFDIYMCAFFITAFFTLNQSWIWLYKTKNPIKNEQIEQEKIS